MIDSSYAAGDDDCDLETYVQRVIDHWREFGNPSAAKAIRERPELNQHEGLVLDLVYEEYCLRREDGEKQDGEEEEGTDHGRSNRVK